MSRLVVLLALFVLSCSKEPPLSSDSPHVDVSSPAGKVTDDDCDLCFFLIQ